MARIYKATDLIPVKVDDLTINVSPLTFEQKMQVQSEILKGGTAGAMRGAALACRYAVKSIKGIENGDGSEYEVKTDGGLVTPECWDDLQNVKECSKLITICLNLINGVPDEFVDPETKKRLAGVSIIREKASPKK